MRKVPRRVAGSLAIGLLVFVIFLAYLSAPRSPPKCDGQDETLTARSLVTRQLPDAGGRLNMDAIHISSIETLGTSKEGVVRCRAMFEFNGGPHGPFSYSLRPIPSAARFDLTFDEPWEGRVK